ncbi:nematode cuticle collagen domain protein [Cooperia oncophora]
MGRLLLTAIVSASGVTITASLLCLLLVIHDINVIYDDVISEMREFQSQGIISPCPPIVKSLFEERVSKK